ncbi:colorectal mutant cancer protein isoform X4 [Cryptotermes secundus]|uniref:colorectal mutant cancer protein isoform X4 n=1 Tax=Cryptotermes secundus TaxID=105785 RepID=UPI000CD7CA4F|nr:colorectal mutant cancer protein isoform X4 [Cryptotermes secundus]XP_023711664.1 colorectal mutant cancer protein isoform X4 [Cryptotermes secundus]XP_023711665.1 colorectal mutant cancer protein isoform X4 [Cryptotermes secundus]XP_023711666.1 colorectal mutant cancer protein isoform X4 [Cryptotermes secundus]
MLSGKKQVTMIKQWEMRTFQRKSLRRLRRMVNCQDLLTVCRELNLEDSLEELMRELGADEQGRISYQEFLRRRLALRPEIDALRGGDSAGTQVHCRGTPEYLPTSSDNSLGAASGGGKLHESWEFDSGARDLSPEPHTLQKLVEAAGGSLLTSGATGNMLDLANKLHLAALASLKGEILDLSNRLHTVTQERDLLEKTLSKTQLEKLHLLAETEERAELQAQHYEERLTELHSVIAELSRKIDRQRALVIREEDDISENEDPEVSRCEAEGSTANLADDSELQDGDRTLGDADSSSGDCCENQHQQGEGAESPTDEPLPTANGPQPHKKETATSCHSLQMAALAEELAQVRAENAALQEQLVRQEEDLSRARGILGGLRGDRDRLRKKIREVEGKLQQDTPHCATSAPAPCPVGTPASNMAVVPQDDMPVCKVAERVVLRKMDNNRQITGSQLATYGVCNTVLAESLVSELQEADLQELSRSEAVRRQYEIETERLTSRLEHARAQNAVLALTLDESKTQCDRLSLLVGKYESNATALRLALTYSDRAIEAYDVLVALLESELGLLLANCRAAGIGNQINMRADNDSGTDGDNDCAGEVAALLRRAGENRQAAETVARHLLSRLDNASTTGGMGPWDDYSHTTSTSSSSDCCSEWGQGEERRLRDHIGKLKTDRSSVRATVVELESCHAEPLSTRQPMSLAEARKLDLETAVLMQELMAMREDKAELRARVYLLEKERSALELKLSSQEAHQAAQEATVQHLQVQLQDVERRLQAQHQQDLGCEGEDGESELADALRREARLKERLQELVTTLEKVGKNSELRHQQSADLVNDLKRANSALVQTLERSKKKYQSRLKKLEQQMLGMVERHSAQVRTLKQKINTLEEELATSKSNSFHSHQQPGNQSHSSGASETSL